MTRPAAEWTLCPLGDCRLVALVERVTAGAPGWQGGHLIRTECIAGHARLLPAGSLTIYEVLE